MRRTRIAISPAGRIAVPKRWRRSTGRPPLYAVFLFGIAVALALWSTPSTGTAGCDSSTAGEPASRCRAATDPLAPRDVRAVVGASGTSDPFRFDPLGLIANIDIFQKYSLGGPTWHLWMCSLPHGDRTISAAATEQLLNRTIAPFFVWLSGGRYRPVFRSTGSVSGADHNACRQAITNQGSPLPVVMVDDTTWNGGGALSEFVYVGGGAVITAPYFSGPRLSVVAQEIGHSIGLPHSYGGNIYWSPSGRGQGVFSYDNPMDMMDSPGLAAKRGTLAINRYAAGWIEPHSIAVHSGPPATYELRGIGRGGYKQS